MLIKLILNKYSIYNKVNLLLKNKDCQIININFFYNYKYSFFYLEKIILKNIIELTE